MTVDEVLALDVDELAPLQSPVLLIGLTGWFDVAGAATAALAEITDGALTVGEIDADPFYDFTQERPTVELVDGETRHVSWPANDFKVVRTGGAHDLVVLIGVEPHLAWPLYIACSRRIVERLHCEAVVTLGATADALPHTRMPPVVGSTADVQQAADRWRVQHDELVADDEQLRAYVRMLEIEYDRRAEAALRRADDIGDQFEAFLREQREERGPDDPSA
jgi:hypothetical protein